MSDANDRQKLTQAANDLSNILRDQFQNFEFAREFKLQEWAPPENGWWVELTKIDPDTSLGISIDRTLQFTVRKFWFGFWSEKRSKIDSLTATLPPELQPGFNFNDRSFAGWTLKKLPPGTILNGPIREDYRNDESYFGIYDIEGGDVDSQLNISRAVSFISNVLKSDVPDAFGDEAFEGVLKQRFIAHRSREYWFRQRKIQEAKTKNGGRLICEVPNCEFDF
jgi:hypothetical protein